MGVFPGAQTQGVTLDEALRCVKQSDLRARVVVVVVRVKGLEPSTPN